MDRCGGGAPTGAVMQREGGRIVLTPPGSIPHGATALRRSVRKVPGQTTLIQRCTIQARQRHRPSGRSRAGSVAARPARAFHHPDSKAGPYAARDLAQALQARHLGAAASLREGLEEMFTMLSTTAEIWFSSPSFGECDGQA
jgi:hypothetical protein